MTDELSPKEHRLGCCLLAYLFFSYAFMYFVLNEHPDWLDIDGRGWQRGDLDKIDKLICWIFAPITMPVIFGFKALIMGTRWLSETMF